MIDVRVRAYTLACAAGVGLKPVREALRTRTTGLRRNTFTHSSLQTWIGRVPAIDEFKLGDIDSKWHSRNNILAAIGLDQDNFRSNVLQALSEFGSGRVSVVIGSSTAGIEQTERGYKTAEKDGTFLPEFWQSNVHHYHAPALFIADYLGVKGPAITISTACSSSAKAFATAYRWLSANIADAVVVGGVDTLCLTTLHGFDSLQLISPEPCRPFDRCRDGINIGEAAGYALLVRKKFASDGNVRLRGFGESSDAYHMSHPHSDGRGAQDAMKAALKSAKLEPRHMDYINLHGTASRINDLIEAKAVADIFPISSRVSSTKGWTGHTLGAAGVVEAIIAIDTIHQGMIPGTLNLEKPDDALAFPVQQENSEMSVENVMSNSFGFGGNNCCLIFSRQ